MRRTHLLAIASGLKRYILLLLVPVIRQLLVLPDPSSWGMLIWWELLAFAFVIFLSVLRWRGLRWRLFRGALVVEGGLFIKRRIVIRLRVVSTAYVERPLWLAMFGAAYLRLDTAAGTKKDYDLTIVLPLRQATQIAMASAAPRKAVQKAKVTYRARAVSIAVMAASASSAVAGLLFAVPIINNMGKLLGEELAEQFYSTVDIVQAALAHWLPSLSAILAGILAIGWFVAFLRVFLRNAHFTVHRTKERIICKGGAVYPRQAVIRVPLIHALDIRQSFILSLFNLKMVNILSAGYGKSKGANAVLIPAIREDKLRPVLQCILPELLPLPDANRIRPHPVARRLYKNQAPWWLLGIFAVIVPGFKIQILDSIMPLFLIAALFLYFWRLWLGISCFKRAGLVFSGQICSIRCCKGFNLHEVVVPTAQIQRVQVTQGGYHRKHGLCNVKIWIFGEKAYTYTVTLLPHREVIGMLEGMFRKQILDPVQKREDPATGQRG